MMADTPLSSILNCLLAAFHHLWISVSHGFSEVLHFLWMHALPITALSNTTVFLVGAIFTAVQLIISNRSSSNARMNAIYSNIMNHNEGVYKDKYKRLVVDQFRLLSTIQYTPKDEVDKRNLYWATRSVHLNHLNLLVQVWLLAGHPRTMGKEFKNWEKFASDVVKDLRGDNLASKPDWYREACKELWLVVYNREGYPPGFISWLERVSK